MTDKLTTLAVVLALTSLGCGGARTLIGEVDGAAPGDTGAGSVDAGGDALAAGHVGDAGRTCTPVTFPGDAPFTLPAGVTGIWTGYFQGGSPLPSSDVLRISILPLADGSGEIQVVMGTAAPPPPATSATDYYPPGGPTDITASLPRLIDGFSYRAHAVTWDGQRLKMRVSYGEPSQSWCALQLSYAIADRPGTYNCVPGLGGGSIGSGPDQMCHAQDMGGTKNTPVSCAQLFMCFGQCSCDACGCAAAVDDYEAFDVTFDGDLLTGVGAGKNIRLTRDAI